MTLTKQRFKIGLGDMDVTGGDFHQYFFFFHTVPRFNASIIEKLGQIRKLDADFHNSNAKKRG